MKYSVVIPCFNNLKILTECFSAVLSSTGEDTEIILVNNQAPYNDVQDFLSHVAHPRVRVLDPGKNLGPLGGQQYGKRRARGEFLVHLDDDVVVPEEGWINAMEKALLDNPDLGIVSLLFEPATPELGRGEIREAEHCTLEVRCEPIFAMCAMTERSVWQHCFSGLIGHGVYDFIEPVYFQALKQCEKKSAYLTSHYVKHLARTEQSDLLYGIWKVLYAKNFTKLPFEEWREEGYLCSKTYNALMEFGYSEQHLRVAESILRRKDMASLY